MKFKFQNFKQLTKYKLRINYFFPMIKIVYLNIRTIRSSKNCLKKLIF